MSSRMSGVSPLPWDPLPGLGFASSIVTCVADLEGIPSLAISSVVPLSGVCR
jgi:hypothetical protein